MPDFTRFPDLAMPAASTDEVAAFGHTGKVYDGWETRRRREPR